MAKDGQTVPRQVEEGFEIAGFEHSLYFIVMVFLGCNVYVCKMFFVGRSITMWGEIDVNLRGR